MEEEQAEKSDAIPDIPSGGGQGYADGTCPRCVCQIAAALQDQKQYRNGQLICRQGERQCQQNRTVDAEPCADRIQRRRERQEQVSVRRTDMAYQP